MSTTFPQIKNLAPPLIVESSRVDISKYLKRVEKNLKGSFRNISKSEQQTLESILYDQDMPLIQETPLQNYSKYYKDLLVLIFLIEIGLSSAICLLSSKDSSSTQTESTNASEQSKKHHRLTQELLALHNILIFIGIVLFWKFYNEQAQFGTDFSLNIGKYIERGQEMKTIAAENFKESGLPNSIF